MDTLYFLVQQSIFSEEVRGYPLQSENHGRRWAMIDASKNAITESRGAFFRERYKLFILWLICRWKDVLLLGDLEARCQHF